MVRFIVGFLLIASAFFLVSKSPKVQFYMNPPEQRLFLLWQKDIEKLYKDEKFKKAFKYIAKVEIHFTDPDVAEEFSNFKSPFKTGGSSGYILRVNVTRWIQKNQYGFVIQHDIFDQNEDKVYEFGRTYQVGFIF